MGVYALVHQQVAKSHYFPRLDTTLQHCGQHMIIISSFVLQQASSLFVHIAVDKYSVSSHHVMDAVDQSIYMFMQAAMVCTIIICWGYIDIDGKRQLFDVPSLSFVISFSGQSDSKGALSTTPLSSTRPALSLSLRIPAQFRSNWNVYWDMQEQRYVRTVTFSSAFCFLVIDHVLSPCLKACRGTVLGFSSVGHSLGVGVSVGIACTYFKILC